MTDIVLQIKRPTAPPNVLEGQLFGAILELPDPLTLYELAGMVGSQLTDKRIGVCWDAGRKIAERGRKVDAATVLSVVSGMIGMPDNEARDWLRALQSENMLTKESFGQTADDLKGRLVDREAAAILEAAARELRAGNGERSRICADIETAHFGLLKADCSDENAASDVVDLDATWGEHELLGTSPLRPTGIKLLDETITGAPPNLMVMAAQPGVGKNMVLSTWIRQQLETTKDNFGLFALEDGSMWLTKRWYATDLKMPLNMVGHAKRTPEQFEKMELLKVHYHDLLQRLQIYRFDEIRPDELVHKARGWIHRKKVKKIWIDHLGHMDYAAAKFGGRRDFQAEKRNEQVTQAVRKFASLAYREEVPIIALAHTVRPEAQKDEARPPRLSEIAESAGIERRIRCAVGLWRTKAGPGGELRLTVLKNTEGPGVGVTMELEQNREAATIEADGGCYIDLDKERKQQAAAKDEQKEELTDARRKKREAKKAAQRAEIEKATAERDAAKKPQLTLLDQLPPEAPKP